MYIGILYSVLCPVSITKITITLSDERLWLNRYRIIPTQRVITMVSYILSNYFFICRYGADVRRDARGPRPDAVRRILDQRAGGLRAFLPAASFATRPQGLLHATADATANPTFPCVCSNARPPSVNFHHCPHLLPINVLFNISYL